jgi:hypothetical protein
MTSESKSANTWTFLDGLSISGTNPVRVGLSVKAIIDETPQWMTATGGKSVSGAGGPASSSTNLN